MLQSLLGIQNLPVNSMATFFSMLYNQTSIRTVAMLSRSDALSSANAQAIRLQLSKFNYTVVADLPITFTSFDTNADTDKYAAMFSSLPSNDLLIVNTQTAETASTLAGAAQAKIKSKAAFFPATLSDGEPNAEHWLTALGYHSSLKAVANIPGVLFASNEEFVSKWQAKFNSTPTPTHANTVSACEVMMLGAERAQSKSPEDIRIGMLSLSGTTFYGGLHFDPKLQYNDAQRFEPYQMQNDELVQLKSIDQFIFDWSWLHVSLKQSSSLVILAFVIAVLGQWVKTNNQILHNACSLIIHTLKLRNEFLLTCFLLFLLISVFSLGFTNFNRTSCLFEETKRKLFIMVTNLCICIWRYWNLVNK